MKTAIRIPCQDCGKTRLVKTNGMLLESYIKIKPVCKSCGAKRAEDKIRKGWFKKGQTSWNTGKRDVFKGKTKDGLHAWVERNLGKPKKCDKCKDTKCRIFQWSNKSGLYKSDLNDWQRLCVKCHCEYDYLHFGARKIFYEGGNAIYD